jgi:DNA-binding transcriptional regulator YhcF (GntR family)
MEFRSSKGIFQQIAENICEKIITGEMPIGSKLPSVREQSASIGVNQNTIMRTYSELQRDDIISNKRGIGYFVTEGAPDKIRGQRRDEFFKNAMPEFIKQVKLLQLTESDLMPLFNQLKENNYENK